MPRPFENRRQPRGAGSADAENHRVETRVTAGTPATDIAHSWLQCARVSLAPVEETKHCHEPINVLACATRRPFAKLTSGEAESDLEGMNHHNAAVARPAVKPSHIALLIAVSAVSPLGINMYLPSMPGMARAL